MRKTMIVPRLRILAAAIAAAAVAAIALVGVASGNSALAASSLVNGNFETGSLSGWTADTTASGGTASAVKSYVYYYQVGCTAETQYGGPCYDAATVLPHEGSYFASLKSEKPSWNSPTPTDTKISQPFKASAGDKISGWAFFQTDNYLNQGWWDPSQSQSQDGWTYWSCPTLTGVTWTDWRQCRDKGQVLITSDSGAKVVATPWEESVTNSEWHSREYSGWKYWEYTLPAGTVEGNFQVEARVGSVVYYGMMSAMGLDDVKVSTNTPDATKPSTTATVSPQPSSSGWNKDNATVTLKATDNTGGWGVQKITYSASGAQTIAQTDASGDSVKVAFDREGTSTLTYYATDNAGNIEDKKTLTVKIDKTAPSVKSTSPANNATRVSTSAKISATFLESGSGVDPATLNDDYFFVYTMNKSGSTITGQVTGTISYDETSKTVTFTPSQPLAKATLYYARLSAGCCPIKDKAGNPMSNSYSWKFST